MHFVTLNVQRAKPKENSELCACVSVQGGRGGCASAREDSVQVGDDGDLHLLGDDHAPGRAARFAAPTPPTTLSLPYNPTSLPSVSVLLSRSLVERGIHISLGIHLSHMSTFLRHPHHR